MLGKQATEKKDDEKQREEEEEIERLCRDMRAGYERNRPKYRTNFVENNKFSCTER